MFKSLFTNQVQTEDPPISKFIFGNTAFSIVWLVLRVWLGWQWISASQHKISDPAWVTTGEALKGFWLAALKTDPRPVITYDWYRQFIQMMVDTQSYTWFAKLIAYGELMVGIALIIGAFTGIAAFFAGFMNFNFLLAGSASTNPVFFIAALLLVLAWKTAGWYGLDRWLLPMLGTPWKPGRLIKPEDKVQPQPVPVTTT